MHCSCKNTPKPPIPHQPSKLTFLDIVKGNSVTPPNGTYKMRLKARIGEQIHNGTGLLTYSSNPDGSIEHYFQTNFEGPNTPFIYPLIGKGFLNLYEYQSHDSFHHTIHSFITNKLNIYHQDLHIHINAEPSSCCCCEKCCGVTHLGCVTCNGCYNTFFNEAKCCSKNTGSC
jgi:hypothetical protein